MPPAHATADSTRHRLTATLGINADEFMSVSYRQLKQTYAVRKERLFTAYKLPAPRVTRIQAFFGVDKPPKLTCEWVDTKGVTL